MATTADPVVVFSALCFREEPATYSPSENAPSLVEVSEVSYVPMQMDLAKVKDFSEKTIKATNVLKSLSDIAKTIMEKIHHANEEYLKKIMKNFKIFSAVADILKGILEFVPSPEDPMVKELKEMADTVEELGNKIGVHFEEMKGYISEVNFFVKIMSPTMVLSRYMMDCIINPGPRALGNFKRAYARHPPLQLAYNFKSYLEQSSTNPLKMAMAAEKAKTSATFNKWEVIFSRVLGHVFILESFASGLLEIKHQFNWDRLLEVAKSVMTSMDEWKTEYSRDEATIEYCWTEMEKYMKGYVTWSKEKTNAERAQQIKDKLETFLTSDAFYVIVFANGPWNDWYVTHGPDNWSQILKDHDDYNCAYIYRSRKSAITDQSKFDETTKKFGMVKQLTGQSCLENVIKSQVICDGYFEDEGFMFLAKDQSGPVIQGVNCPGHEWGPGWWETVTIDDTYYKLLVGLP